MNNGAASSLHRSPRATLEQQQAQVDQSLEEEDMTSTSSSTNFSRQRISHSYKDNVAPNVVPVPPPLPRRSSARLRSDRLDKRLPLHMRRRTSLETIASVTTTNSAVSDEDDILNPPEATAPSSDMITLEEDPYSAPVLRASHSAASSVHSASTSSKGSLQAPLAPKNSRESVPHSPKALFKKMTHRKVASTDSPEKLIIERKVSIDRSSYCSNPSPSSTSLVPDQPFEFGFPANIRRPSRSSSEWSGSSFDTTTLTEAELKKCKKKGINPALYAEMKAARKGKWTSPIAGNSFL